MASSDKDVDHIQKESQSRRKWLVLLSGYYVMFVCLGFAFNMSVFNSELLTSFEKGKAETAIVQSTTIGSLDIAGVICGKLVARYGARTAGITGSAMATLGMVLSFFATSIPYLIATVGLMTGLGFSAAFISAATSVSEYFEGNGRLMALSFVSFGTGCGAVLVPYILQYLTLEFGWRGCLLIFGGLTANLICCFAVCKPLSINKSQELVPESLSKADGFMKLLHVLVTNRIYIIYVIALCVSFPLINSSLIFLFDFLTTKGFDSESAMTLYSYLRLGSALSTFLPGLCKKYIPHTSVLILPAFFTIIGSTATALLPRAKTFTQCTVLLVCYGINLGVCITTSTVTTMKLVQPQDYSAAMGVMMTLKGISTCIAGPIAGLITDQTGSYTAPFYCVSAGLGLATCLLILAAALKKRSENRHPVVTGCSNEGDNTSLSAEKKSVSNELST